MAENPYQAPEHYAKKQSTLTERRLDQVQTIAAFGSAFLLGPRAAFYCFANGRLIWGSVFVAWVLVMACIARQLWIVRKQRGRYD